MLDKLNHWIANHLPRRLVYWCGIRMMAHATTGPYGHLEVPAVTGPEMLVRWAIPRD